MRALVSSTSIFITRISFTGIIASVEIFAFSAIFTDAVFARLINTTTIVLGTIFDAVIARFTVDQRGVCTRASDRSLIMRALVSSTSIFITRISFTRIIASVKIFAFSAIFTDAVVARLINTTTIVLGTIFDAVIARFTVDQRGVFTRASDRSLIM